MWLSFEFAAQPASEDPKHEFRNVLLVASVLIVSVGRVAATQTDTPPQRAARSSPPSARQAAEVSVVGCLSNESGRLKLSDEDGNIYHLIGNDAELGKQVGDELEVSGTEDSPPTRPTEHSVPETTLRVARVKTIVHRNPAGVRPSLGDVANWAGYRDETYGVGFGYPRMFERLHELSPEVTSDFVVEDGVVTLQSIGAGKEIYPNSNFYNAGFTAFVNPNIRSEGTCKRFASFWPEHTFTFIVNGIKYAETLEVNGSAGSVDTVYHLHTYQSGFCYEFAFEFNEEDGTGMPLMCAVQWLSAQNEHQLIDSLLSQVSFVTPAFERAVAEKPSQRSVPLVPSFDHGPVVVDRLTRVKVSWSTRGADFVQLHYPCTNKLYVSALEYPSMRCGTVVDRNLPANGSAELLLGNYNPSPVPLALSIEPFSDGAGYPEQSKTITIPVSPHP